MIKAGMEVFELVERDERSITVRLFDSGNTTPDARNRGGI
jgi:hypothetical protein